MSVSTLTPAATEATAPPLGFDERLALAALAVDARIHTEPLDLAEVIRVPVDAPPTPTTAPYRTPIAALLHRARTRLEAGWCTGALRDEQGNVCLIGAIRAEAPTAGAADDACRLLLDVIQSSFPDAETIPSWNDAQTGPRLPLRMLDRAAATADARGI